MSDNQVIPEAAATLTPDAVSWFRGIAEDAERDIAALPEGSQPLWFRTRPTP